MARPTILVGIGSGGLRSIEAAWKLYQEVPRADRPEVEYIYLETDQSNKPISTDIVFSSLVLNNAAATVSALQNNVSCTTAWLTGQNVPENVFAGAGGAPFVGRLTLWDNNNRNEFTTKLHQALAKIRRTNLEKPVVFVVGSLGGGTGSGTFLDIAYLIRDALANQVELQGLFLIPNTGLNDTVIYSNTICSLKELEYFGDKGHEFPFKWNANPPKGYEAINTPYDLVQVISAAYNEVLPPVSYNYLHEEAGIFLYLNSLGLYDVRRKSLIDASSNLIIDKYTTFGLAAIHYPESDIKDILGNRFSAEMLNNIVDDDNYFDKKHNKFLTISSSIPQITNSVKQSFDDKFVEILHQWCGQIGVVENGNTIPVDMHIQNLAHMLASGNYNLNEKKNKLWSLFKVGGEYYKQLVNLCVIGATDRVISVIIGMVRQCLNDYQNINVAIAELNAIAAELKEIQTFWTSNGYTADSFKWEENLKELITNEIMPMPTTYKLQFEQEKVYADRIKFILLYGLAMHLFSDSLSRIQNGILGSSAKNVVVQTSDGKLLPTIPTLQNWKQVISRVINDPSNIAHVSCKQVEANLLQKLQNQRSNIAYIYPQGSLEATLEKLENDYKSAKGQNRFIDDIMSDNLYDFLLSLRKNVNSGESFMENDLYLKVVPLYTDQIQMGEFSVTEAINSSNYDQLINLVEGKSLIPHLPINPTGRNATFENHDKIPHILLAYDGADGSVINDIATRLENNLQIHDYHINDRDRNKCSHVGLNNWLIFYKEFGHMSDGKPFNIIRDLHDFNDYANCYRASVGDDDQDIHGRRMPYIDFNECCNVATKYATEAIAKSRELEYEEAIELYQFAMYWNMTRPEYVGETANLKLLLSQETSDQKFTRFFEIGNRYMDKQEYSSARTYYLKANNIQIDNNVQVCLQRIDRIATAITVIHRAGDAIKAEADALFDQILSQNQHNRIPDCLLEYQRARNKYQEALQLSANDSLTEHKILDVDRRMNMLNTNI